MVDEQNATQEYRSRLAFLKSCRLDHKNTSPNAELREIQDGINSWVRLSKKLSRQLSTIVAANDKFLTNSAGRFKGLGRYLSSIREIIDDLEAQNMKLTDRKSDWETLHQDVSLIDLACLPLGYRTTNSFIPARHGAHIGSTRTGK